MLLDWKGGIRNKGTSCCSCPFLQVISAACAPATPTRGVLAFGCCTGTGRVTPRTIQFSLEENPSVFSTRERAYHRCPHATAQQSHCEGPRAGRYFQRHSQTPALLSSVPGHPKCSPHRNTNSAHPFMLWGATSSPPTVNIAIPAQQPAPCHAQATSVLFCVSASRNDKDIVIRSTQLLQLHTRLLERKA